MADTERDAVIDAATRSIRLYTQAQERYAQAAKKEAALDDLQPVLEAALIGTLIGTDNPLTSTSDKAKPHSASSAAEAIKVHPEFLQHREYHRDAVLEKNQAFAESVAARLTAQLAITTLATIDVESFAEEVAR